MEIEATASSAYMETALKWKVQLHYILMHVLNMPACIRQNCDARNSTAHNTMCCQGLLNPWYQSKTMRIFSGNNGPNCTSYLIQEVHLYCHKACYFTLTPHLHVNFTTCIVQNKVKIHGCVNNKLKVQCLSIK